LAGAPIAAQLVAPVLEELLEALARSPPQVLPAGAVHEHPVCGARRGGSCLGLERSAPPREREVEGGAQNGLGAVVSLPPCVFEQAHAADRRDGLGGRIG